MRGWRMEGLEWRASEASWGRLLFFFLPPLPTLEFPALCGVLEVVGLPFLNKHWRGTKERNVQTNMHPKTKRARARGYYLSWTMTRRHFLAIRLPVIQSGSSNLPMLFSLRTTPPSTGTQRDGLNCSYAFIVSFALLVFSFACRGESGHGRSAEEAATLLIMFRKHSR
jgi:hypothetical protein